MAFFNVQKYPPSLLYVCATLGPMLLLVPVFDRLRGPVAGFFRTFGSVPLMAYVAHLFVMHALAVGAHAAAGHNLTGMFNTIHYFFFDPGVFAGDQLPAAGRLRGLGRRAGDHLPAVPVVGRREAPPPGLVVVVSLAGSW